MFKMPTPNYLLSLHSWPVKNIFLFIEKCFCHHSFRIIDYKINQTVVIITITNIIHTYYLYHFQIFIFLF